VLKSIFNPRKSNEKDALFEEISKRCILKNSSPIIDMKLISTIFLTLVVTNLYAQRDFSDSEITKLVLLGTGTPILNPDRSGCSVAVVVNSVPYIIDFGPGLIRRLAAVTERFGNSDVTIKGLDLKNTTRGFLTHLHSDHSAGYPDLILTPWSEGGGGRDEPLEVYGPEGINKMTEHILEAYEEDIKYRLYGAQPINNQGWRVNSHEVLEEGVVYQDENVKVEAFPAPHGTWPNAWSFRFRTPDKVIVISGDTSPSKKLTEYAKNADLLLHEVYSKQGYNKRNDFWKNYHSKNHTSTYKLAEIANKAKPKKVVLYHILFMGASEKSIIDEISEKYSGKVVLGNDLDIF